MMQAQPSPEQQITFLNKLQRLLTEADFSSTYKYALLLALAELAVELGDDSGGALELPIKAVAEKFALYYWPQAAPFSSGTVNAQAGILAQNRGKQTAIVRELIALRSVAHTWFAARRHPQWPATLSVIAGHVKNMPLKYLQNVGRETIVFLYEPEARKGVVRLLPGVTYHLRYFQGFVQQLVRAGWLGHVRANQLNIPLLGNDTDLESFMFGTGRSSLHGLVAPLARIQERRCFFCQEQLGTAAEVDHFIPWTRYPRDTGLNFVLAHNSCNNDKRDLLAGPSHVERWLERNARFADALAGDMLAVGFSTDQKLTTSVARWAYSQSVELGADV
jgi:5-methylcytosine-specific restriction endonuclease McrA